MNSRRHVGEVDEYVINPKELGTTIIKLMDEYGKETFSRINKVTNEVTKDTKKEVKKNSNVEGGSPFHSTSLRFPNRVGKYAKSISRRTEKKGVVYTGRIYAKDHEYSLTHLLEKGHRLVRNGVTVGETRPNQHWKKGEELAQKEFAKEIIKELSK